MHVHNVPFADCFTSSTQSSEYIFSKPKSFFESENFSFDMLTASFA